MNEPDDAAGPADSPAPMEESSAHGHRHQGDGPVEHFRHTRISAAWVAVTVAVIFGVALIVFIAQNTKDVHLKFFSASGSLPVAVALLAAALCGAIVVLAIGVGRVAQLRLTMRRQRRRHAATPEAEGEGSSGHAH